MAQRQRRFPLRSGWFRLRQGCRNTLPRVNLLWRTAVRPRALRVHAEFGGLAAGPGDGENDEAAHGVGQSASFPDIAIDVGIDEVLQGRTEIAGRAAMRFLRLCRPERAPGTRGHLSARRAKTLPVFRSLSSPRRKKIHLYRSSELPYVLAIPAHQEGRSYVVTDRGRGCGGRGSVGHEMVRAGRAED
jgi:hypothetical protein